MEQLRENLLRKIKVLSETIWDRRADRSEIDLWLSNFKSDDPVLEEKQKLHALYLLSQFMYFASREMRVLLRSMYRDLIRYPIIESIRKSNNDTTDITFIINEFKAELGNTRFLGVGNPSESGAHLLYYFRQENLIEKNLFINSHEIFKCNVDADTILATPEVKRYIFIDDFCGSGSQAIEYSENITNLIKKIDPNIEVWYFVLFANESGLDDVRQYTRFDKCDAVFKLDDTYKCFGVNSRYKPDEEILDMDFARDMAISFGSKLYPDFPLGFDNNELLLGFFHNTPDNTLPIIWFDEQSIYKWNPIFRRYPKIYGDKS